MSKLQIFRMFKVENSPQILCHVKVRGRVFIVEMMYPNLGSIRQFLGNFLMDTLFGKIWTICKLPSLKSETQSVCIRKLPGNFLMHPGMSDPGSIRQFPRNFLMDPRKKFKLFLRGGAQVGRCRGLQGGAMANGCCDFVNGLECRLEYSQASSHQACRFWNFFLGPIPDLF